MEDIAHSLFQAFLFALNVGLVAGLAITYRANWVVCALIVLPVEMIGLLAGQHYGDEGAITGAWVAIMVLAAAILMGHLFYKDGRQR